MFVQVCASVCLYVDTQSLLPITVAFELIHVRRCKTPTHSAHPTSAQPLFPTPSHFNTQIYRMYVCFLSHFNTHFNTPPHFNTHSSLPPTPTNIRSQLLVYLMDPNRPEKKFKKKFLPYSLKGKQVRRERRGMCKEEASVCPGLVKKEQQQ